MKRLVKSRTDLRFNQKSGRFGLSLQDVGKDIGRDVLPGPADELDIARSLAEIETHASLIEQAEDRLKQIDDALGRLERALYGMCEDGGEKNTGAAALGAAFCHTLR